jgi:hypothetical protein
MLNIRCKNIKNQFVIVQNSSLSGKIRNKLVIKIDVEPKTILYLLLFKKAKLSSMIKHRQRLNRLFFVLYIYVDTIHPW